MYIIIGTLNNYRPSFREICDVNECGVPTLVEYFRACRRSKMVHTYLRTYVTPILPKGVETVHGQKLFYVSQPLLT